MRNYFDILPAPADVCSYHNSRYISEESLEAFFIVSDFVIGKELCDCTGSCNAEISSCVKRHCSGILEEIQKEFLALPLSVELI
jgi:NAD(P)H-nitrite reductase large subunit